MALPAADRKENFIEDLPVDPLAVAWLEGFEKTIAPDMPAWMIALKQTAAEAFRQSGFPKRDQEGWQYTNLRPLLDQKYSFGAQKTSPSLPQKLFQDGHRVVMLNGVYRPDLSDLPAGVKIKSLADIWRGDKNFLEEYFARVGDLKDHPFVALNTAMMGDGICIELARAQKIEKPIELLHYTVGDDANPPALFPRVQIIGGKGSDCALIERHMGEGRYFSNLHVGVQLEEGAKLALYTLQEAPKNAVQFTFYQLCQKKDSIFEGFSLSSGGVLARQEHRNELIDSGIYSNINTVYLLKDRQCHDFTALMDHFEPKGKSVQHFKGVIDDQARAVFQGKIQVRRSAQGTDGYQLNHALLLSAEAEACVKPELEIFADDVKCSHGAASGQLDTAALFYLKSRGIPEAEARMMLIYSFLNDAVEKIPSEDVREIFQQRIRQWLQK